MSPEPYEWKRITGTVTIRKDKEPWRHFRGFAMFGTRDLPDIYWYMQEWIDRAALLFHHHFEEDISGSV